MVENTSIQMKGFFKIIDRDTGEVIMEDTNAIHFENMSIALANNLAHKTDNFIYSMVFGNGGSYVDLTGIITYLSTNTTGSNSALYNQTYSKVVDDNSSNNTNTTENYIQTMHPTGYTYTDIVITCLLDVGEPSGQSTTDVISTPNNYEFDELGIMGYSSTTPLLLTHAIFHPVLKSTNRAFEIIYTIRINSLSGV